MTETYHDEKIKEMVGWLGQWYTWGVESIEMTAENLHICPRRNVLVKELRVLARQATELAREIDREELGFWKALKKEVQWYIFAEKTHWAWKHQQEKVHGGAP